MQQVIENMKPDIDPRRWFMVAAVDLHALKVKSFTLARECNDIVKAAKSEKRDLTNEEYRRWEDLASQYEIVEAQITSLEANDDYGNAMLRGTGRRTTAQGPDDLDHNAESFSPRAQRREPQSTGLIVGKTKEGNLIRAYRPKEALPMASAQSVNYDFQDWIRAIYTGDYSSIRAETTQTEGVGGDGGWLVHPQFSRTVIELIRNKTQVVNAGALTIPMETNSLTFAKQVTDPSAYWRGELQPIPPSKATFEAVHFQAHSLGVIVTMSEELLMDSPNAGTILQTALASALALKLDSSFLSGDGVGKPTGVTVTDGVQSTAAVGTLSSYAPFSEAAGKLWATNHTPGALLMNGLTAAKIDALVDAEDRPLLPPPSWSQYAHLITNQIEQSGTTSTAILADWSNLWIGMRMEVRIDFDRSATAAGVNAFESLGVHARGWLRADAMVVRPSAFVLIPGITTTP